MIPKTGTPTSIDQAIENGLIATGLASVHPADLKKSVDGIRAHVRDFLAQRFNVATIQSTYGDELVQLFKSIVGEQ